FKSFLFALFLTPVCRDIFRSYNVVDRPDQGRKIHEHPIPRVGGLAIAISYLGALFLVFRDEGALLHQHLPLVGKLLPAAGIIVGVGLIDDLFGLKPWHKLIGQIAGASWAYWAGVRILQVALYPTADWWSFPLTLIWLLACTNAFNLVDGLDGLSAGLGLCDTL